MATITLNVGNFVTLKLNNTNYPLWREQILALAKSQELVEHLTDESPPLDLSNPIDAASSTRKSKPTLAFL